MPAAKRSIELFRHTWGDHLRGQVGPGLAGLLAFIPLMLLGVLGGVVGSVIGFVLIAVAIVGGVVVVTASTEPPPPAGHKPASSTVVRWIGRR